MAAEPEQAPEGELATLHAEGSANVDRLTDLLLRLRVESSEVAGRKWAVTLAHLAGLLRVRLAAAGTIDVVTALELSRALGDLYLREVLDELEAELNETPAADSDLHEILRQIEQNAEEGSALADRLFRTALDHLQNR